MDDREGLRARYGQANGSTQPSYYGYEQEAAHHTYDRSSSVPVNQPGSMLSPVGRFPNSGTPQSSTSQLPSLNSQSSSHAGYLSNVYGSNNGRTAGMNASTSSLVSPPMHSSASNGSFLSASSAPNGIAHHRLHSDSSLATLSSAGASSSTMSPRTPLNGPGSDAPLLSPSANKMSSFNPPQPTVPTASGTFLQQDASRPFPLKMPKAPTRGRSGTGSLYLDQQSAYYGSSLAPVNVKLSVQQQAQQQQQQQQQQLMQHQKPPQQQPQPPHVVGINGPPSFPQQQQMGMRQPSQGHQRIPSNMSEMSNAQNNQAQAAGGMPNFDAKQFEAVCLCVTVPFRSR